MEMKELVTVGILVVVLLCLAITGGTVSTVKQALIPPPTPTPRPDPVEKGVQTILEAVAGQVDAGTGALENDTRQAATPYKLLAIGGTLLFIGLVGYLVHQNKKTRRLVEVLVDAGAAQVTQRWMPAEEKPVKERPL